MVLSCIEWSGWIIVGRKERRRKKKGRFYHMSLDHGQRSGRSPAATWSVPVQVHSTYSRCKPAGASGQLEGLVKDDRCVYALRICSKGFPPLSVSGLSIILTPIEKRYGVLVLYLIQYITSHRHQLCLHPLVH